MIERAEVEQLYARYAHALFRRCKQLVASEADAHELVQETFLQFWRGRERFRGDSSPFTFLYRIATNLSIDKLRRRTTAGSQVELLETEMASGQPRQDARLTAMSELAWLTLGLDDETLTIAVMLHVDGLTQEEIAASLGLSRRTIGKRVHKFEEHVAARRAAHPSGGAAGERAAAAAEDAP